MFTVVEKYMNTRLTLSQRLRKKLSWIFQSGESRWVNMYLAQDSAGPWQLMRHWEEMVFGFSFKSFILIILAEQSVQPDLSGTVNHHIMSLLIPNKK